MTNDTSLIGTIVENTHGARFMITGIRWSRGGEMGAEPMIELEHDAWIPLVTFSAHFRRAHDPALPEPNL